MRKITRNDINTRNMVTLGYCQCQTAMRIFADEYRIGYNTGVYGWNYDLYTINDCDIVTGYRVPYYKCSDNDKKKKLIAFDNKLQSMKCSEIYENYSELKQEFLEILK